ncbi:MAG: GNAT family N-acetyltransferase [Anaerobacillus sp.]|uniref:GNAT family N-acetyltransferase n=1 Tax=Anaerobacillus sp. TaxID=1872506 RepID=UPI00391BE3DD
MNSIIRIKQEHISECAKLYCDVFNAKPWNDNWTIETAYQRLNDISNCPHFEGVLFVEQGIFKGAIFGNYEQFYDGKHYNLREMFVATDQQGTGIGTRLLCELEMTLNENGITTMMLFTSKGNKTSDFYMKNGFSEWTSMAMMGKAI